MLTELDDETVDMIMVKGLLNQYYECDVAMERAIRNEDFKYYMNLRDSLKVVLKHYMVYSEYEDLFGEGSYQEV